ncbi:MAG: hypothetical protein IPG63_07475 [Xanthomonadales bacterium]|nr:hypothetical protein [Xanthomonadales bacterium]
MAKKRKFQRAADDEVVAHAAELDWLLRAIEAESEFHEGWYSDECWIADVFP